MTADLVQRLGALADEIETTWRGDVEEVAVLQREAADAIERLREGIRQHREDTLHSLIEGAGGGTDAWALGQAEEHDHRLWSALLGGDDA